MIALLQRVSEASCTIDARISGAIGPGLLVFLAIQPEDDAPTVARMAQRVLGYRVFADNQDRMNLSLLQQRLELLVIPQFTLAADTRSGMRASFTKAAQPEKGREYFERFVVECKRQLPAVKSGVFGADMQIALINDGPVTFWLEA